jgi:hypothetical protein
MGIEPNQGIVKVSRIHYVILHLKFNTITLAQGFVYCLRKIALAIEGFMTCSESIL